MPSSCDIAIVGGGMVGASLALLCAKANPQWQIQLIEPHPFVAGDHYQPSFDARSTALSAGSVELLSHLDIWPELARHATSIARVHVSDKGYLPGQLMSEKQKSLGAVIENAWLGQVLMAKLLRVKNITQVTARVLKCVPQRGSTQLLLADNKKITCALAVIADGANSPIREGLGIHVEEKNYKQGAIIANVDFTKSHQGTAYERFTDTGPLALLPLGGSNSAKRAALIWTLPLEQARAVVALNETEFLARLQLRFGRRLGEFTAISQRYMYPLSMRIACEQVRTGIVLMGNAVHFLHPVAGQGFNLALRDCAALTLELNRAAKDNIALGTLEILKNYEQRQQYDQRATAQVGDKLVSFFGNQTLPVIALRHLGLLSLELFSPLRTAFSKQVMGLAGTDYSAELVVAETFQDCAES